MSNWYPAHNYTPADANSLQAVPNPGDYTDLVTGDMALCYHAGQVDFLRYDSTSSATQNIPLVVTPDGNAGNGRWLKMSPGSVNNNGFSTEVGPVSDSYCTLGISGTTFTLTHVADYDVHVSGAVFTITGNETVEVTAVAGVHWIYFDDTGTLSISAPGVTSTRDLITSNCVVAAVLWETVGSSAIMLMDERHGNGMSPATHYHLHEVYGAEYETGLSLSAFDIDGDGDDATAAQFDLNSGEFHDEDIAVEIATDTNATIDTFYKLGATAAWAKLDAVSNYPVADGTIDLRLDWNDENGGTWRLQEVANNDYVLTHYFATNDILGNGIIGIMGEAVYATRALARTGAEDELATLTLSGLPGTEMLPIATVIWQTGDGFTNQVAARIVSTDDGSDYIDWRTAALSGVGATTSDHESLSGLLGGATSDHYHLTGTQHTDLTDAGETTLHTHPVDHAESHDIASHSDVTDATGVNLEELTGGGDTTLHDHDGITENTAARHAESHTVVSHSDTTATGPELDTLTGGGDTTLHDHDGITENTAARHAESHDMASHSDVTDATGANLEELTGGGDTNLHEHNTLEYSGATTVQTAAEGVYVYDSSGTDVSVTFANSSTVELGKIFYDATSASIIIGQAGTKVGLKITENAAADLYYNNVVEASTASGQLTATNAFQIASSTQVTGVLDEDDLASDSAVSLATQQSIKSYSDANVVPSNAYTTTGAITTTQSFIELDGTAGALAMTYAAPVKGKTVVITCTNADNDCVVTLGSGNFYYVESGIDDSGNVATFNTVGQTLHLFGVSATRYNVVQNIGHVGIE